MLPIVAPLLVNESRSWPATKFPVICTVPPGSDGLSRSATVMAGAIATAAALSAYANVPPAPASTGKSFTATTETVLLNVLDAAAPSLTW
jgi:hypothetical protein